MCDVLIKHRIAENLKNRFLSPVMIPSRLHRTGDPAYL
jgi:hypothetical protein